MKNNRRKIRIERRNAKIVAVASEQLALYRQAAEFHKAYLEIELGVEEAKFEEIQARLAALQPTQETVVVTEEEIETLQEPEETLVVEKSSGKPVEEW